MQKQLMLLHNATAGFFSGDVEMLERCLKAFHIRLADLSAPLPSATDIKAAFLELTGDNIST